MDLIEKSWKELNSSTVKGENQVLAIGYPDDYTHSIFLSITSSGNRMLLIQLDEEHDISWRFFCFGLEAIVRDLRIVGAHQILPYIQITCLESESYQLFNYFIDDIVRALQAYQGPKLTLIDKILERWQSFWDNEANKDLSREKQIGLFGELNFLQYWLIPHLGAKAVMSWCGSRGLRHDFEMANVSIEVKSTSLARGHLYEIHGIQQLEKPQNGRLFLFGVRLRDEQTGGKSLKLLIDNIYEALSGFRDLTEYFSSQLIEYGYSLKGSAGYQSKSWEIIDEALFLVDADFPRITSALIPESTQLDIEDLTYKVNLNHYSHLIVATNPSEFAALDLLP